MELRELLQNITPPDEAAREQAHRRWAACAKPLGSLGLLETALAWMEANTRGALWIGVWSGNLRAQALYAAYGFEKAGEYQYAVGDWRDDEFILRRR